MANNQIQQSAAPKELAGYNVSPEKRGAQGLPAKRASKPTATYSPPATSEYSRGPQTAANPAGSRSSKGTGRGGAGKGTGSRFGKGKGKGGTSQGVKANWAKARGPKVGARVARARHNQNIDASPPFPSVNRST